MLRIALAPICALVAGLLLAGQPAVAAEIYVSGALGNASTGGSAEAEYDGIASAKGDDADSSPAFGGSLGLAFPIDEAVPTIKQFEMPSWIVRTEMEFITGRDNELITDAVGAGDKQVSEVDAWTLMPNLSLEVPIREPVRWAFGRVPVLELMSVYANVGIGVTSIDLSSSDNLSSAKEDDFNFAWQAGAGITYELTDTTTFVLGYRYVSLGTVESDLMFLPDRDVKAGSFEVDLSSHEIMTGLRIDFYNAPLKDMHPRYWRAPRVPMPGWLPSWLGGPSDEEESDADEL
jgi:Outer membrane protein beta-barrel domain